MRSACGRSTCLTAEILHFNGDSSILLAWLFHRFVSYSLSVSARHFSHVEERVFLAFLSAFSLPFSVFPFDSGVESMRRRIKCFSMPLGIEQCAISVIGLRIWCTFACAWRHFQSHSAAASPSSLHRNRLGKSRATKTWALKDSLCGRGPAWAPSMGAEQRETWSCEPSRDLFRCRKLEKSLKLSRNKRNAKWKRNNHNSGRNSKNKWPPINEIVYMLIHMEQKYIMKLNYKPFDNN